MLPDRIQDEVLEFWGCAGVFSPCHVFKREQIHHSLKSSKSETNKESSGWISEYKTNNQTQTNCIVVWYRGTIRSFYFCLGVYVILPPCLLRALQLSSGTEPHSLRWADDGFLALGTPAQDVCSGLTLSLLLGSSCADRRESISHSLVLAACSHLADDVREAGNFNYDLSRTKYDTKRKFIHKLKSFCAKSDINVFHSNDLKCTL